MRHAKKRKERQEDDVQCVELLALQRSPKCTSVVVGHPKLLQCVRNGLQVVNLTNVVAPKGERFQVWHVLQSYHAFNPICGKRKVHTLLQGCQCASVQLCDWRHNAVELNNGSIAGIAIHLGLQTERKKRSESRGRLHSGWRRQTGWGKTYPRLEGHLAGR